MKNKTLKYFLIPALAFLLFFDAAASNNLVILRLTHNQSTNYDETAVRFLPGATQGFDAQFDAWKMFSSVPNIPSLYTKDIDNNVMSINSFNELSQDSVVNLFANLPLSGNYSFSVINFSTEAGVKVFLEDLSSNTAVELNANTNFDVFLNSGVEQNRFRLRFSTPLNISQSPTQCQLSNDGTLTVSDFGNHDFGFELYDDNSNLISTRINIDESAVVSGLYNGIYHVIGMTDFGTVETGSVEIVSSSTIAANFQVSNNLSLSVGSDLNIINESVDASDFEWDFGDGFISNLTTPLHAYDFPGDFQLTLVVFSGVCSDTTSRMITVGDNQFTNIGSYDEYPITVYYSNRFLTITSKELLQKHAELSILNMTGATVVSKNYAPGASLNDKIQLDLPSALYITKLTINNQIHTQKILIQN